MNSIFVPLIEELVSAEASKELWEELTVVTEEAPNLEEVLPYLPEIEAEMFWLCFEKRKNQKEIAQLLRIPQSTVSYRCRRAIQKVHYLMLLTSVNIKSMVDNYSFLRDQEKAILTSLFYTANQDLTGRKFNMRQSSVKWIYLKTRRKIEELEKQEPDKWFNHLGLMCLLEKNLGVRVM